MDAVHAGLEPAAGEMGNCVCQVHSDSAGLSRYPGPVAVLTQDLKPRDGLTEEKSYGSGPKVNSTNTVR